MKKVLALALAAVMVMALCGVALAAVNDNVSITINGIHEGDTLKLYPIATTTYNSTTNQLDWSWNGGLTETNFTFTTEGYSFTQNSAGQKAALDAYNAVKTITPTSAQANASGEATVSVAPGYYVAFVEGTADSGVIYQRMLIDATQVADTTNNTYGAHGAITADVKKEPITITKTEDLSATDNTQVTTTDNYHIGDSIHFTLTSSIPSYPETSTYATFVITDTPTGLDDDSSTVTVNVGGTAYTAGFTVADDATGKGFTVSFTKEFILAHPAEQVIVEYNAVLEGPVDLSGATWNDATITYNPNPSEDTTVTPPGPHTDQNIYGVVVYKYDDVTSNPLPGASFKLVAANATGDAPANPEVIVKNKDGNDAVGTTDANGYISWSGLPNGTYYLIETAAPAGYRLDATPRQVVLNSTNCNGDDPTTADPAIETYFLQEDVPNTPGATLPTTGGIGTTIFYVSGLIMVLGAAVILVARRRADAK